VKKVIMAILSALFVLGIIVAILEPVPEYNSGSQQVRTSQQTENDIQLPTNKPRLEILDYKPTVNKYGNLYIIGHAKNVGETTIDYAEISVKFYDKDGNVVATFFDNTNNLAPGETWRFKVLYPGEEFPNSYKIQVSNVW